MREADVSLSTSDLETLGIAELVGLTREAGIVGLDELACRGDGAILEVEVAARLDEGALDDLAYVNEWEYAAETADGHLYLISFTAPGLPADAEAWPNELVGTCDPTLRDGSAELSLVGEQETIASLFQGLQAVGIEPDLERLGRYAGDERPLDRLTARQREVLRTAFEEGYYDVPRGAGTDAIAEALDLDSSTVAEHLQRAERNLLQDLL